MPVRIYDLAKKLGLESKAVLAKAKELGIAAKVPSSSLDKITAEFLEQNLAPAKPAEAPKPEVAPEPIKVIHQEEAPPPPPNAVCENALESPPLYELLPPPAPTTIKYVPLVKVAVPVSTPPAPPPPDVRQPPPPTPARGPGATRGLWRSARSLDARKG